MSASIQPIQSRPPKFRKFRKWQPEWKPEYEAIVSESCTGKSNVALAEKYNFTVVHISNILNTEQARKIKEEAIATIRRNSMHVMESTMASITDAALKNIEKVICDEQTKKEIDSPLAIFDKSLAFLKGVGKLANEGSPTHIDNSTKIQQNFLSMSPEQRETFDKGLDKALGAIELHKGIKGESIN